MKYTHEETNNGYALFLSKAILAFGSALKQDNY